jgi:hypothetical protein
VVSPVLVLPDVPQVDVPDDDEQTPTDPPDETPGSEPQDPVKTEPVIVTSLDDGLPLRPAYYEGDPPVFGEPVSGRVITQAVQDGDATDIAVYVHLTDLSPGQASIYASYAGGAPVAVQLIGDGGSGCYGLLIDDPSMAGSNWTWHYGGSGSAYHNISIAVTTYDLGTHELRLYAYDAATGVRISEVEVTRYTVYGSGGGSGLFDTELTSDIEDPFVPGAVYNLTFVDSCRCDGYSGSVRSVFKCPYAVNVWLVGGDGEETLLTPSSLGEYLITWTFDGSAPHEIRLRVQLGEAGGSYPASIGQYWLEDVSTGMVLSPISGEGVEGTTFSVRGPEPPLP